MKQPLVRKIDAIVILLLALYVGCFIAYPNGFALTGKMKKPTPEYIEWQQQNVGKNINPPETLVQYEGLSLKERRIKSLFFFFVGFLGTAIPLFALLVLINGVRRMLNKNKNQT